MSKYLKTCQIQVGINKILQERIGISTWRLENSKSHLNFLTARTPGRLTGQEESAGRPLVRLLQCSAQGTELGGFPSLLTFPYFCSFRFGAKQSISASRVIKLWWYSSILILWWYKRGGKDLSCRDNEALHCPMPVVGVLKLTWLKCINTGWKSKIFIRHMIEG